MKDRNHNYYITKVPRWMIMIGVFEVIVLLMIFQNIRLSKDSHYTPEYRCMDLNKIADKARLTQSDYETLFFQTGLSPHAIDIIKEKPDCVKILQQYQDIFFRKVDVDSNIAMFLTKTEYINSDIFPNRQTFELAPLEDGYVLYTPSSSTFGWRNGHIALVVDKDTNKIFEAESLGSTSLITSCSHWTTYPAFVMLRIKPEILSVNTKLIPNVISTVENKLTGLPYSLFCGITTPKASDTCNKSHCAHIIWYAFNSHGINIDCNDGAIVTPENIMNSDLFEVVQIYGVNPALFIDRIAY